MEPVRFAVLLAGAFFLAFGLAAYRYFYTVLGAAAGLAMWIALSDFLLQLPGLREHPGTASILILIFFLLTGVFIAWKFRKLVAFLSGVGTGIILTRMITVFMSEGVLSGAGLHLGSIDAMDILVGLIGGILFVLFERLFALLLTSVVGSFLCTRAIGLEWIFPLCLLIGLVAQPLIFLRIKPPPVGTSDKSRTG